MTTFQLLPLALLCSAHIVGAYAAARSAMRLEELQREIRALKVWLRRQREEGAL